MDGEAAGSTKARKEDKYDEQHQAAATVEVGKPQSPLLTSESGRRAEQTSSNKYKYLRKKGAEKGKAVVVQMRGAENNRKQAANTERRWTQNPLAPSQRAPGSE